MSTIPTNSKPISMGTPPERPDFYVTGGTLPASASSYVARAADTLLLDALRRGEFCYVLNTRQMGKSSLMARAASHLLQSGIATAVLDLTAGGRNLTVDQWYHGLLERVGQQLGLRVELRAFARDNIQMGPLPRFMEALIQVVLPARPGPLVIFIDEIDAVRSLPFATDELFAGIRELYNRRTTDSALNRLTFCLLGVATPADLIKDTRTTPFNIGTRIRLDDFTPGEAAPLAQGMIGSQTVLDRVLFWTGGHPYLTQRLCRAIAEEPGNVAPSDVDALCETLFLSRTARDTEDNLLFVRERVLRSELDVAALLTLYGRILRERPTVADDPADPLASALKLAGLVKADASGTLIVRNRIYARVFGRAWVTENMPGGEVRRQRQAFWRGAVRTGSIAAVIIAVIGALAFIAVREAHEAERQSREAKRQAGKARTEATQFEKLLYVSDMQNAQSAWDSGNLGRLRELLAQTQSSPERGFEWGYWNHLAYPPGDVVNPGDGPMTGCDVSPDGTRLATVAVNGMVRLWNTDTLRQVLYIQHLYSTDSSVSFSRDGTRFIVQDYESSLSIYSTATGKRMFSYKPINPALASEATSPDLDFVVASTRDHGATLIQTSSGRVVANPPISLNYNVSFANDSNTFFATAKSPFDASIYSTRTGTRICNLQIQNPKLRDPNINAQFTSDDRFLVTNSASSGSIDQWDTKTGQLVRHLATIPSTNAQLVETDPILPIALIEYGKRLREYSTTTGMKILDVPCVEISGMEQHGFSQNGRYLGLTATNGEVYILDVKTGVRTEFRNRVAPASDLAISPIGDTCFSVSSDGTFTRWKPSQRQTAHWQTVSFPLDLVKNHIELVDKNQHAFTVNEGPGSPTAVRFWKIKTNRAVPSAVLTKSSDWWMTSDNGTYLAVSELPDDTYGVFDLQSGHCKGIVRGNSSDGVVSIGSEGQRLSVANPTQGEINVYDVQRQVRLWTRNIASGGGISNFSSSNRLFASALVHQNPIVYDAETGRQIAAMAGPSRYDYIFRLVIPPGDKRIITISTNQMLQCWDIASGKQLWSVLSPIGRSIRLSYSPDGQRVVTTSKDDTVGVWDVETGDLLLTLRGNGYGPRTQFSPDGNTLEVQNRTPSYIDYIADMTIHHNPAAQ